MTTFEPGARLVFTHGFVVQPALDRLLREQAGGDHHRRVRRVRAARDGGDDDRAVVQLADVPLGQSRWVGRQVVTSGRRRLVGLTSGTLATPWQPHRRHLLVRGHLAGRADPAARLRQRHRFRPAALDQVRQGIVERLADVGRATRSCGRVGPARLGSTVARSSSSVSLNRRLRANRPCGTAPAPWQYASTSSICSVRPVREPQVIAASRRRPGRCRRSRRTRGPCWRSSRGRRAAAGRDAGAEELDELADDALLAEHLRDGQHQVGRGRPFRQLAVQLEADDLRNQHRHRLAEHRRLGLDAADAPAEHAEAVDHRRVRVGADERVRVGDVRPSLTNTTRARYSRFTWWTMPVSGGTTLKLSERRLAPAEERVALLVPLEFELGVVERTRAAMPNSSTCTEWSMTSSTGWSGLICARVAAQARSSRRAWRRGRRRTARR